MSRDIPKPDFSFPALSLQYRQMCKEFGTIQRSDISISEILEILPTLSARLKAMQFMLQYYNPALGIEEDKIIIAIHSLINQTITLLQDKEEESGHVLDLLQPLKQQLIETESELGSFLSLNN